MRREISIYVHIPFCERKCAYCAFNSFIAKDDVKEDYVALLCDEIERRAAVFKSDKPVVKTIYFGGGTPSVLSEKHISKIVATIFENFDVYDNAEFTIEANPNSLTEEKLGCWKGLRVNRLSIGVQALDDNTLAKIGRLHTKKEALEKIKLARKFFDNVSADLIVGLENQTGKDLCRYAKDLIALGVKHISTYLLEVYEGTPIFSMIEKKQYRPLDDEQTILAFNKLANYLQDQQFERYEISNFAREGYESRHNLNYWARGEYLGFGISAHSFVDGVRMENAKTIADYKLGKLTTETLSPLEEDEEKIMLGLRCCLGVNVSTLKEIDLCKNPFFEQYVNDGILIVDESARIVTLNPIFYHLSNTIISNLFR